jgi:hypothetical protein
MIPGGPDRLLPRQVHRRALRLLQPAFLVHYESPDDHGLRGGMRRDQVSTYTHSTGTGEV